MGRLLKKHLATASEVCASLKKKHITFHCLRHTSAMDLLHAGVEQSVIALWLGHERMDTTQIYLYASRELKEKALAKTEPFYGRPPRYRPPRGLPRQRPRSRCSNRRNHGLARTGSSSHHSSTKSQTTMSQNRALSSLPTLEPAVA